jgi:uncharacterized protein
MNAPPPSPPYSLIFLPTLRCDADCEYCFENKGGRALGLDELPLIFNKLFAYLEERNLEELQINWQGGEVLTLPPRWIEQAVGIIGDSAAAHGKRVQHLLQSNLLAYGPAWQPVIAEIFGGAIGSSVDYPNRHRKAKGGTPRQFNALWLARADAAREAGNHLGVIALPSRRTLEAGAEAFYRYFTEELGLTDFQLNTPFAGGAVNAVKGEFPPGP